MFLTCLTMFLNILGELYYDTDVIRGALGNDFLKEESRYTILKEQKEFIQNTIIGARVIIYK